MKHINCLCIATLVIVGTQCPSRLNAQDHDTQEQYTENIENIEFNTAEYETVAPDKCGCNAQLPVQAPEQNEPAESDEPRTYDAQEEVNAVDASDACVAHDSDLIHETAQVVVATSSNEVFEQANRNETTSAIAQDVQQVVAPVIAAPEDTQQDSLEAEFDNMVDELVQSGALEDDIATLEAQPKWKLFIARIGSYALSLGLSCKEIALNFLTQVKDTASSYWTPKKAPAKKR